MTRAEYVAQHGCEPHDEKFWGPGGVDVSRWGSACQRGIQYQDHGPVTDGQRGAIRKISSGRKARGMASDSYER